MRLDPMYHSVLVDLDERIEKLERMRKGFALIFLSIFAMLVLMSGLFFNTKPDSDTRAAGPDHTQLEETR